MRRILHQIVGGLAEFFAMLETILRPPAGSAKRKDAGKGDPGHPLVSDL